MIIFCGIQATGKSTFYKDRFFNSHIRISMDLLNTRNKESKFLELAIATQSRIVIDNKNPSRIDREKYLRLANENRYKVVGYYFQSKLDVSIARNNRRVGKEKISDAGLRGTYAKLEIPTFDEGFSELYYVELINSTFIIKEWSDEI